MTETAASPAADTAPALPPTAAQRYWDENRERLEIEVAGRRSSHRMHAEAMTIADLRTALEAHNENTNDRYLMVRLPAKTAPKEEYVTAYVEMNMRGCDEEKAVQLARYAVSQEEGIEYDMRSIIADRDKQLANLTEALTQGPGHVLYRLEWSADSIQSAIVAAGVAEQYLAARERGVEPALLAKEVAKEALRLITDVASMGSNLRMDSHGLHRMAKAAGHKTVLGKVARLLDEDTSALLGMWF